MKHINLGCMRVMKREHQKVKAHNLTAKEQRSHSQQAFSMVNKGKIDHTYCMP